jgi:cell division transport system permease protein
LIKATLKLITSLNLPAPCAKFGLYISLGFGFIALLIIFNTVRLAIFTRRDEIEIMNLVGASHSFVRMPFIIEALISGFLALIIATTAISLGINSINQMVQHGFNDTGLNLVTIYRSKLFVIIGIELLVVLVIGVLLKPDFD